MRLRIRKNRSGFTLIEIMIVVLVIGILVSIAVPNWAKAREKARAQTCISNLTQLEHAKEQFAMEARKANGAAVAWTDLVPAFIKHQPQCPSAGDYSLQTIGTNVSCSVSGHEIP